MRFTVKWASDQRRSVLIEVRTLEDLLEWAQAQRDAVELDAQNMTLTVYDDYLE